MLTVTLSLMLTVVLEMAAAGVMQAVVVEEAVTVATAEIAQEVVEEAAMVAVVAALLEELVTVGMAVLPAAAVQEEPVTVGTVAAVPAPLVLGDPVKQQVRLRAQIRAHSISQEHRE
jgi:hypothetical protein